MENIYNFLKDATLVLKRENKSNNAFIPIILLFISIPLLLSVNNVSLAIFLIVALCNYKKFKFNFVLFLPISLYFLMILSFFWSINKDVTLKALSKEITLFIIPFSFMLIKDFSIDQKKKIVHYYSSSILILALYFILRAILRFIILKDSRVFFYHGEENDDYGLVPKLLNAIHVSVFASVAFYYYFTKTFKTKWDNLFSLVLFVFILLLSSKNIIITFLLLALLYLFSPRNISKIKNSKYILVFGLLLVIVFSFGKIKDRIAEEINSNFNSDKYYDIKTGIHYVSIYEAWNRDSFTENDYFPGTSFRVYQFRVFLELLKEDSILLTGYGLNASGKKLLEKEKEHKLHAGYGTYNLHNQYTQNFIELGIFGFIVLIIMLVINVKNAIKSKDFVHISFAFIMISLFLTESFLWRQRGVVFFTLMYCFFNTRVLHNKSNAE